MIGELINQFDNSDGTIKSFNEIFPKNKLKGTGTVEILGIVGVGKSHIRNILINNKLTTYNFNTTETKVDGRSLIDHSKIKATRKKRKNKHIYFAVKDEIVHEFKLMKDIADFIGVSIPVICTKFTTNKNSDLKGYEISRTLN